MVDYGELALDVAESGGGSPQIALPTDVGGGSGGGDWGWGSVAEAINKGVTGFGDFARTLQPAMNLGLAGLGIYEGIQGGQQASQQAGIAKRAAKTQAQVAAQAQQTAAPLAAFSQSSLEQAQQGKIDPSIQTQIDLWAQGAKQQAQQYAAASGQGQSQQLTTWLSWIDQQATAMKAQALQDEQSKGIAAGGQAGGILSAASGAAAGAGQTANTQAQSIEALIAEANKVMASLTAGAA